MTRAKVIPWVGLFILFLLFAVPFYYQAYLPDQQKAQVKILQNCEASVDNTIDGIQTVDFSNAGWDFPGSPQYIKDKSEANQIRANLYKTCEDSFNQN